MNIQKRDIAIAVILSIVTCGIYQFYWIYKMTEDTDYYSGDNSMNPATTVILSIVTCGIYLYYWYYKTGKLISLGKQRWGMVSSDNSLLYLLLGIFGFGIVSMCLMQNELNELYDFTSMNNGFNNQFGQPPFNGGNVQ